MIRSRFPLLVLAGALLFEVSMSPAQETPVAFVGAEIIPIRGESIADGVLIVQGGKILAVEPRGTAVPAGATFREVKGQVILPGLIDYSQPHRESSGRRYVRSFGLERRLGSIESGKDADLALYDGDSFEYTTHCTTVIVSGVVADTQPH